MAKKIFGWFAPKRGDAVLKMVEDHLGLTKATVENLCRMIEEVSRNEVESAKSFFETLSEMEMKADAMRRDMVEELSKSEMFPEEREDLMELVRAVDWVADWSKEAGRILSTIPFSKAPEEMKEAALNMARENKNCVSALIECIKAISVDSRKAVALANEVEILEEEMDELYSVARKLLATLNFDGFTTGALILLNMFLDALETVADWCENTADIVRAISVRVG
ncbi:DUF47 family protein [Candidatus Bathyarchaeota archaeon]|nr:DUF47 family protein [Candidatus Bathyarchaeota archaeon]MBS7630486.1 DUF47 family protein [Candidatus Bathyarchaeota archaeon]